MAFGLRPSRALVAVAALLLVLWVPAVASAQAFDNHRVTAISSRRLLHTSAVALVDPVQQRRARAISDDQELLFAGWAVAPILAFYFLWQLGYAARLRDLLRRRMRSPWL
jgi:hypothetical protein